MLPLALAEQLEADAMEALSLVEGIPTEGLLSLTYEVGDVEIWSYLSLYLAEKIRAGVALAEYWEENNPQLQEKAIAHIESGIDYWETIIAISEPLYLEMPLVHNNRAQPKGRKFHWKNYLEEVKADLDLIRKE